VFDDKYSSDGSINIVWGCLFDDKEYTVVAYNIVWQYIYKYLNIKMEEVDRKEMRRIRFQ